MGLAASRQEAFWEACGFGNVARAKKFLEDGGIDVNWVSYTNDCCPIHVASQGKPEVVQLLLDHNCDVNVLDIRGNLALHHAAMKGHAGIIQTLIDAGSQINVQEKNGWTALHNAAYWCHPDAVRVLLKNGADISIINKDERSALHETARSQETADDQLGEIARMLIDAGSDVNAKSSDLGEADLTGLMYAAYHNHPDVALALIDAGCLLDCVGTTFWTALHWAADRENDELVYILLEAGADPTIKGMRGETAGDRAKSPDTQEVLANAVNLAREMAAMELAKKGPLFSTDRFLAQTRNKASGAREAAPTFRNQPRLVSESLAQLKERMGTSPLSQLITTTTGTSPLSQLITTTTGTSPLSQLITTTTGTSPLSQLITTTAGERTEHVETVKSTPREVTQGSHSSREATPPSTIEEEHSETETTHTAQGTEVAKFSERETTHDATGCVSSREATPSPAVEEIGGSMERLNVNTPINSELAPDSTPINSELAPDSTPINIELGPDSANGVSSQLVEDTGEDQDFAGGEGIKGVGGHGDNMAEKRESDEVMSAATQPGLSDIHDSGEVTDPNEPDCSGDLKKTIQGR